MVLVLIQCSILLLFASGWLAFCGYLHQVGCILGMKHIFWIWHIQSCLVAVKGINSSMIEATKVHYCRQQIDHGWRCLSFSDLQKSWIKIWFHYVQPPNNDRNICVTIDPALRFKEKSSSFISTWHGFSLVCKQQICVCLCVLDVGSTIWRSIVYEKSFQILYFYKRTVIFSN